MIEILNKKSFYSMILKDRFALAEMEFPTECGEGRVEFFRTPLGVALKVNVTCGEIVREIKMYDKKRSKFAIQNIFCGDNLVEISRGVFVGVSNKLSIEDAIGRDFLIKLDNMSIIAHAKMPPNPITNIDKMPNLVYN